MTGPLMLVAAVFLLASEQTLCSTDELAQSAPSLEEKIEALEVKHEADISHLSRIVSGLLCSPIDYNYTFLDDAWRAVTAGQGYHCDRTLPAGWYRPTLNSRNAAIPTECVAKNHCGTRGSTWIDLQGAALPGPGAQVVGRACTSFDGGCCQFPGRAVTVRNCGDYFLYHLKPLRSCTLAYCIQPE